MGILTISEVFLSEFLHAEKELKNPNILFSPEKVIARQLRKIYATKLATTLAVLEVENEKEKARNEV